jgi:hypothetical protein
LGLDVLEDLLLVIDQIIAGGVGGAFDFGHGGSCCGGTTRR